MANKLYEFALRIAGRIDPSLRQAVGNAQNHLNALGASTKKLAGIAAGALGAVSVGAFMHDAVEVYTNFEQAIDKTAATAGATAEECAKLEAAARKMGRETTKTATEAAEALGYMALAGWDVDTSITALESVLRLSEATQMDLATCSDLVTDSMSALGLGVDDLTRYLDIAAQANNKSNQSAQQLMDAYLGVGGTLNNLGVPLEESTAALGVLANRGIKGSEAGTALNAIIAKLTTGTGQAGKMMDKLGISAFDSEGSFIGLEKTLRKVDAATKDLSDDQRNAALAALGGMEHVDALNDLLAGLNTTTADGVIEWEALESAFLNADGALEVMADQMTDNLAGAAARFGSAVDELKIKLVERFAPAATKAIDFLSGSVMPALTDSLGGVLDTLQNQVLPRAKAAFNTLRDAVSPIGEAAADAGAVLSEAFADASPAVQALTDLLRGGLLWLWESFRDETIPSVANGIRTIAGIVSELVQTAAPHVERFITVFGRVAAAVQEVGGRISAQLAPVFTQLHDIVVNTIVPAIQLAIEKLAPVFTALFEKIAPLVESIYEGIAPILSSLVENIQAALHIISEVFSSVAGPILDVIGNILGALGGLIDFITGVFTGNWELAWQGVKSIFTNLFEGLLNFFKAIVNGLIGIINGVIEAINSIGFTIPEWVPGLGGKSFKPSVPKIPLLAEGGIATAPTLAMVGEGAEDEAILPLSKLKDLLDERDGGTASRADGVTQGDEITFAPVIYIQGGADEGAARKTAGILYEEFKRCMERYEYDKKRRQFAPG